MSEPFGPIQIIPPGLMGLLQLKSMGHMPDVLNGTVQPVVDFEPWWLRANRQVSLVAAHDYTQVAAVVNGYLDFTGKEIIVGQKEWWYVHDYSLQVITNLGSQCSGAAAAMQIAVSGNARARILSPYWPTLDPVGNAQPALCKSGGFWAPPQAQLGFWLGTVTGAGGVTISALNLEYTRCPL